MGRCPCHPLQLAQICVEKEAQADAAEERLRATLAQTEVAGERLARYGCIHCVCVDVVVAHGVACTPGKTSVWRLASNERKHRPRPQHVLCKPCSLKEEYDTTSELLSRCAAGLEAQHTALAQAEQGAESAQARAAAAEQRAHAAAARAAEAEEALDLVLARLEEARALEARELDSAAERRRQADIDVVAAKKKVGVRLFWAGMRGI